MKIPHTPPTLSALTESIDFTKISKIVRLNHGWGLQEDRYYHWDELRHRTPPNGFTTEEWWFGIKMARSSAMRQISLKDKKGAYFGCNLPDTLTELLHQIDRELGLGLGDDEGRTREKQDYVINSLIQESITSSQLEGAVTTRAVAKQMLKSGRPPRDKSEKMILNNYRTMLKIRDLLNSELTPSIVFDIHRLITERTLEKEDSAGRFRRSEELIEVVDEYGVVYHRPPDSSELPGRLQAMCDFANGKTPSYFIHPVVRAIVLHFWLAYDHPFVDGNGRTARALFYWCMLKNKYKLFEYISISEVLLRAPIQYYRAFLYTETDDNDLTYFILHQAEVIRGAVKNLREYIDRKKAELRDATDALRGVQLLNHRQQSLLMHALREVNEVYEIEIHRSSHGISYQTARDDLFKLVENGLLKVQQLGRKYHFRAPSDLKEKLSKLAYSVPDAEHPTGLKLDLGPQL